MKKVIQTILLLTLSITTYSQTASNPVLVQPIPPSPNAASLGKYGEVPVGLHTGVPDISIPLWEFKDADIMLPISLSYHASGVKVDETASFVGLGWSLNAGGMITRSVRGKIDEQYYLNNSFPRISAVLLNPEITHTLCEDWESTNYAYNVGKGLNDSEPDAFFFNFNGHSGKFVFDQNGVPYTIPYQPIKIQPNFSNNEWIITTQDGFTYKFGTSGYIEQSETSSVNYPYYGYPPAQKDMTTAQELYPSAWYLMEIDSPKGGKMIFSYTPEEYKNNSGISQSSIYDAGAAIPTIITQSITSSYTHTYGLRITTITSSDGSTVNFLPGNQRQDLVNMGPGTFALGSVNIKDWNGNLVRNFVLNTDYFVSSGGIETYYNYRLRLNSVTEIGNDGVTAKPPYTFSYDNQYTLPPRNSSSQDHWGLYNGINNVDVNGRQTLIPSYSAGFANYVSANYSYATSGGTLAKRCPDPTNNDCYLYPGLKTFQYQGANRDPDFNYSKTAILNKITYPTGGQSIFSYELNDFKLSATNVQYQMVDVTPVLMHALCPSCSTSSTFTPKNLIPTDLQATNLNPYFDFVFSFNLDGNNNICCKGCGEPSITLKDVTTNTVLIQAGGFSGLSLVDASIMAQVNGGGFANYSQPNSLTWVFSNILLDPTHSYMATASTNPCPSTKCSDPPPSYGCPVNQAPQMDATFNIHFQYKTNTVTNYNGKTGGLRIRSITNVNPGDPTPQIKKFVYKLHGNATNDLISSGVLVDMPIYFDFSKATRVLPLGLSQFYQVVSLGSTALTINSGYKSELGQTNGSHVGYSEVQEILCQDSNCGGQSVGKKISTFLTSDDNPDVVAGTVGYIFHSADYTSCPNVTVLTPQIAQNDYMIPSSLDPQGNYYPYPPKVNMDWKRGLPTSEQYLDASNNVLRETDYFYNQVNEPLHQKTISALKIIVAPGPMASGTDLFYGRYDIVTGWNYKTKEVTTERDAQGNTAITTKKFYYDNPDHTLLTRTEVTNSKGEIMKYVSKFVGDQGTISNLSANEIAAINTLNTQYRIATPLQQENYKAGNVVEVLRTSMHDWGTGLILPQNVQLQIGSNTMEPRVQFNTYDLAHYGNLLEEQLANNTKKVFIYGYHSTLPVAEIAGSDYASISSLMTSLSINQTILNNPASDQALITELSKIRTATNAQVTIYTYKPLVGMSSTTDLNGLTTSFEYDPLGQLNVVRDYKGNVIKQFTYNYYKP